MCVCVCDMLENEAKYKGEDSVLLSAAWVEDEGRIEVPESPLHTVWEGWMVAGWGIQH